MPSKGTLRGPCCFFQVRYRTLNNLLIGGLAGLSATVVMTVLMRQFHQLLPEDQRYPLPPREITQRTLPASSEKTLRTLTTLSHFGYGAATGAIFNLVMPKGGMVAGMTYGGVVWLASYLGWVPAAHILTAANRHPLKRTLLMISVHLAWGAACALTARELEAAESQIFRNSVYGNSDAPRSKTPKTSKLKFGKRARKKQKHNEAVRKSSPRGRTR